MKRKYFFLFLFATCFSQSLKATNYYINSVAGRDANKGSSKSQPWKTIAPIANLKLQPGDSVLFASGQQFTGMLSLINVKGLVNRPVVISSYLYNGNSNRPVLDAGNQLNAIFIQNASYISIHGLELTASTAYSANALSSPNEMRCGLLVEITSDENFEQLRFSELLVHDVYYNAAGFTRSAAETKSANGTQHYGWGIRVINNSKAGKLSNVQISDSKVFNVSHTGIKVTARVDGIRHLEISACDVSKTGGPGMQFSGIKNGHIHHNTIDQSGSIADSRNWGRGSGLWTWSCNDILIEHNRFTNANGPGDSAGVHIDYNCSDVVVQYNLSANNAGGFCEILGNNYNCAYRYNISVNDGYRVKGQNAAFQEGKIFWLSGYQGNDKKSAGPYNSYFYNNSIYVSGNIVPKVAVSSSSNGVLIANNIFYFENAAQLVAGDQKKKEVDVDGVPNVVFKNNLYLRPDNWPAALMLQDASSIIGDPGFANKSGLHLKDYLPANKKLVQHKGIAIERIPNDSIGIRIGLNVTKDILGNAVNAQPGLGAIEISEK